MTAGIKKEEGKKKEASGFHGPKFKHFALFWKPSISRKSAKDFDSNLPRKKMYSFILLDVSRFLQLQ